MGTERSGKVQRMERVQRFEEDGEDESEQEEIENYCVVDRRGLNKNYSINEIKIKDFEFPFEICFFVFVIDHIVERSMTLLN